METILDPCWRIVSEGLPRGMANIPTMVHDAEYKDCTTKQKRPEEAPSAPRPTGQPDAPR